MKAHHGASWSVTVNPAGLVCSCRCRLRVAGCAVGWEKIQKLENGRANIDILYKTGGRGVERLV